jgi:MFS transporter, DHA1 family, tetracycline resistance protein
VRGGTDVSGSPTWVRLAILFTTVFIDLVGFGIVLPLLPLYADRFGASGTEIGLIVLSYSAAQLLLAPVWGRLSDRFGRRRVLLLGLLGSASSYVVFAFASTFSVLLLSRVMAGVAGANISVAQAYIADITPPEKRAGNMGLIGAAFGLGFIFGPALGGILAPIAPELPGLVAALLCSTNAFLAVLFLPESLRRPPRSPSKPPPVGVDPTIVTTTSGHDFDPTPDEAPSGTETLAVIFRETAFLKVLLLSFLITTAFAAMHPTFPLFAARRFGLDERDVGWLFAFTGAVSALMQGGLVRILVARMGEAALVRLCTIPFTLGFLVIAVAPSVPVLLLGLGLLAIGFGGTLPSLASLLSRAAPDELQGGSLGIGQSAGAFGRILGPLLAGILWDALGMAWPYLVAAGIGGVAILVSLGLRPIPGRTRNQPEEKTA